MKNWTIERMIAKAQQSEGLDEPGYYLQCLFNRGVKHYDISDGQFTGGFTVTRYIYEGMVYAFGYNSQDFLMDGVMYPVEFL
jgi:hypothetical protein